MYRDLTFRMTPLETIEEDLKELSEIDPGVKTIQLLSANPLVLKYDRLAKILEIIHRYLPEIKRVYTVGRVTDLKNKNADELRKLGDMGMNEISLGVESGDDWTLDRINKGYRSEDILEQCHKLEDAGIDYWMTFLNGVAGRSHSYEHALHSAEIFSRCKPMVVGTGGLTLFPGTPLLEELKIFVENLNTDCSFITHHTVAANLTGPDFLRRKENIVQVLDDVLIHGDLKRMASVRRNKRTL